MLKNKLLPLKANQIPALNFFQVPLLTINLLTTMMHNTEYLYYPCQIIRKLLPSKSAFRMEVASPDLRSQIFPAVISDRRKLTESKFVLYFTALGFTVQSVWKGVGITHYTESHQRGQSQREMNVEVRAVACEVTLMPQMVFNQDVLYFSLKTYTDVRIKPVIAFAQSNSS